MSAAYRSCNFGDSATIYGAQGYHYASPKYVYDNYYDVWAGAGMTWYKFDIWHQYMGGAAMFYHEQGHDEFWMPAGGVVQPKPLQLSPKGRLVAQFLELTKKHPDRGTPFTPIAFLLDQAHGWDPNAYRPSYFGLEEGQNPKLLRQAGHARMLKEWFKVAYHPYGPDEAKVNNGATPVNIPGVFGNIFDVLVTSPTKRDILSSYPVVVLNGELTLSTEWGQQLAQYVEQGGTLILSDGQLSGPGLESLKLPELGAAAEDVSIHWQPTGKKVTSQRYRYRSIPDGDVLAKSGQGATIAASFQRGQGKLVLLSIYRGLGIDSAATPLIPLVLAHARQGLLPFEVRGEVEWLLNRNARGWVLTLMNPAGNNKTQHGVAATSYAQGKAVELRTHLKVVKATEWFDEAELKVESTPEISTVRLTVPAGGVRIVEIQSP